MVTALLEYFNPVNYTCLVLYYDLKAAQPLAFKLPEGTAVMTSQSPQ